MIIQLLHRKDCDYFGVQNSKHNNLPSFKSSITEVFIKRGKDLIFKQIENHLCIWNLRNLQQETANSGESALQKHGDHKMTYGEIRLVRAESEAAMMQEPNIKDIVETDTYSKF